MIFVFKCTYSHFILVLMLICIFLKRFLITRAVRHRVKVSAPVLFLEFFLVHVVLKYANFNRMHFGPGYMSFESKQHGGQRRPE